MGEQEEPEKKKATCRFEGISRRELRIWFGLWVAAHAVDLRAIEDSETVRVVLGALFGV